MYVNQKFILNLSEHVSQKDVILIAIFFLNLILFVRKYEKLIKTNLIDFSFGEVFVGWMRRERKKEIKEKFSSWSQ